MKEIDLGKTFIDGQKDKLYKGECKIRLANLYKQINDEQKGIELFSQQLDFVAKYMDDAGIDEDNLRSANPDVYKFRFKIMVELEKRKGRLERLLKRKEERENEIKGEIYGIC